MKKLENEIYQAALDFTQCAAEECLFIDDRPLNLEMARRFGINTFRFNDPAQLQQDLLTRGVEEATRA